MLRNITFSAEASLLDRAREVARRNRTTVNAEFRLWLARYTQQAAAGNAFEGLMERLAYAQAGGPFSREALNERG